jgi:hypothetical protein
MAGSAADGARRRRRDDQQISSLGRYVVTVTLGPLTYGRRMSVLSLDAVVQAAPPGARSGPVRCLWCGRELPSSNGVGRRRRYCAQACRQRAYENRNALERGSIPPDSVVLTQQERDDLADRLYQVRCAAEDVATALAESAGPAELAPLVSEMLAAARSAERIR